MRQQSLNITTNKNKTDPLLNDDYIIFVTRLPVVPYRKFFYENFFLASAAICSLSKSFSRNVCNHSLIDEVDLSSMRTQFLSLTSSGVAQPLYHNTGTHKHNASAVAIPKLSLAILINPLACLMRAIFSCTSSMRHTKIIVGHAIDLA